MKENKLRSEPAFPEIILEFDGNNKPLVRNNNGMSKRFYAACIAMQGLLANEKTTFVNGNVVSSTVVKKAYELSEELLKQENQ